MHTQPHTVAQAACHMHTQPHTCALLARWWGSSDTLSPEIWPQRRLAWLRHSFASLRRLLTVAARRPGSSARRLALPVPALSPAGTIWHGAVMHLFCNRFSTLREVVMLCGGCAGNNLQVGRGGRGPLLIFRLAVTGRYHVGLPRPWVLWGSPRVCGCKGRWDACVYAGVCTCGHRRRGRKHHAHSTGRGCGVGSLHQVPTWALGACAAWAA